MKRINVKNVLRRYSESAVASKASETEKTSEWDKALPYSSIPGPKSLPVFGNMWRFVPGIGSITGDPIDAFRKFREQYGDVVKLDQLFVRPDMVFLYNPKDIEYVFRNEGVWPYRIALDSSKMYHELRKDMLKQEGLGTAQGKDWFDLRSKVNPILMQPRSAQMYINAMDEIADEFVERVRYLAKEHPNQEMPEDFVNELNKWALESVTYVALDKRLGCFDSNLKPENQKMIDNVSEMFDLMFILDLKAFLHKYYPTATWKKYVKVVDEIVSFALKHIEESSKTHDWSKPEHEMSVFERLMKKDKNAALTMTIDMLKAGVDTTSKLMSAVLYFLAKNQAAQNKLRKELSQVFASTDEKVTKEKLQNLPYLKAVVKETLRMASIAPGTVRTAYEDMVVAGYQIPKGMLKMNHFVFLFNLFVIITFFADAFRLNTSHLQCLTLTNLFTMNLLLCLDDRHFPRAKEFIPERWLRDNEDELSHKNTHPFVTLPFGFGPRSCIGKRLANLEVEVLLSKIIRNFSVHWNHEDPKFKMGLLYGLTGPLRYQMIQN